MAENILFIYFFIFFGYIRSMHFSCHIFGEKLADLRVFCQLVWSDIRHKGKEVERFYHKLRDIRSDEIPFFVACSKNCKKLILSSSSLCLTSVHSHETTRLRLDRFALNLILKYFFENLRQKRNQVLLKFDTNDWRIRRRPMYSCWIVLGMRNVP